MEHPARHTSAGFAMFAVIVGLLVLSTLTMTALEMGLQATRASRATRVSASALYAAESGVNVVSASWPTTVIAAGDSLDLGWTYMPNGGRYRAWIHRRDTGTTRMQIYSLTVEGWSPGRLGGQAAVQVWATRFLNSLFTAAVAAKSDITLSGAVNPSFIDSYDSRLGDYGATLEGGAINIGASGGVHANGDLHVSGDVHIDGSVTVGGEFDHDGRAVVTGAITEGVPPEPYPAENCPAYTPISGAGVTYKNGSVTFANVPYTLTSGTYSFHDFVMEGGATLVIPAGNFVRIYLSGELNIGGTSNLNNEGRNPAALAFVSCNKGNKTNTTTWELHGGSGAYFTVNAPNNTVNLNGGSPVYGAIIANRFVASGGAAVHFDVALAESNTLSVIAARSWRQLLR